MNRVHIVCVVFVVLMSGSCLVAHPLHDWARVGNLAKMKQFEANAPKNKKIDWDVLNSSGQTPLMIAVDAGKDEIVIYLLDRKVDTTIKDKTGKTALNYVQAASAQFKAKDSLAKNYEKTIKLLMNTSKTKDGETELIRAIKEGDTNKVDVLINSKEIDINAPNALGQTPLHVATLIENESVVDKLVKLCSIKLDEQDQEGNAALHYAAQRGNVAIVMALTRAGARVTISNKKGKTPKQLIGKNNKNIDKNEALAIEQQLNAVEVNPVNIEKAKRNCVGSTVTTAVYDTVGTKSDKETVTNNSKQHERAALEQFDEDGKTLLTAAACQGNFKNVEELIAMGAAVNASDENLDTPLLAAVKCYRMPINGYRYPDVIALLLERGASIFSYDGYKKNPLHYAVEHERIPVLSLLFASLDGNPNKAAIIDAQDENGDTPLHYATATANLELVEKLLAYGAQRNIPNKAGKFAREVLNTKRSTSENTRRSLEANIKKIQQLLSAETAAASGTAVIPEATITGKGATRHTRTRSQAIFEAPEAIKSRTTGD